MVNSGVQIIEEKDGKNYLMDSPSFEILMNDDRLEQISVNGPGRHVYIFHRDQGRCRTNLIMDEDEMMGVIKEAADNSSDYINRSKPFLDARLPDGSRLNATIPPATPEGPTITISKFREKPFSIIDLVQNDTLSFEAAAFLWTNVEGEKNYPQNILSIGGTGTGKTTTLNTLTAFVPRSDKITVIEDTLELNFFGRENLVRMEAVPGSQENPGITMNDLLINALRMRPDRVIMGEVRGSEAESLFNAMNIGHSAMGTLHANSPSESKSRLTNPPMNVPVNMLPLVDLMVVQKKVIRGDKMFRRVSTIVEVSPSEVGVSFNEVFTYNPQTDNVERTDVPSIKLEELAKISGKSLKEVQTELRDKEMFLRDLADKGVTGFKEVGEEIQKYYIDKNILGID